VKELLRCAYTHCKAMHAHGRCRGLVAPPRFGAASSQIAPSRPPLGEARSAATQAEALGSRTPPGRCARAGYIAAGWTLSGRSGHFLRRRKGLASLSQLPSPARLLRWLGDGASAGRGRSVAAGRLTGREGLALFLFSGRAICRTALRREWGSKGKEAPNEGPPPLGGGDVRMPCPREGEALSHSQVPLPEMPPAGYPVTMAVK